MKLYLLSLYICLLSTTEVTSMEESMLTREWRIFVKATETTRAIFSSDNFAQLLKRLATQNAKAKSSPDNSITAQERVVENAFTFKTKKKKKERIDTYSVLADSTKANTFGVKKRNGEEIGGRVQYEQNELKTCVSPPDERTGAEVWVKRILDENEMSGIWNNQKEVQMTKKRIKYKVFKEETNAGLITLSQVHAKVLGEQYKAESCVSDWFSISVETKVMPRSPDEAELQAKVMPSPGEAELQAAFEEEFIDFLTSEVETLRLSEDVMVNEELSENPRGKYQVSYPRAVNKIFSQCFADSTMKIQEKNQDDETKTLTGLYSDDDAGDWNDAHDAGDWNDAHDAGDWGDAAADDFDWDGANDFDWDGANDSDVANDRDISPI